MNYFIQSAYLSQSIALAKALRVHAPAAAVIGVVMPAEPRPAKNAPYTAVESYRDDSISEDDSTVWIPTGGCSTRMHLQKHGSATLGGVRLTRSALQVWDKLEMLTRCRRLGIPTPLTYYAGDEDIAYPVFCKGAFEGGRRFGVLYNRDDLLALGETSELIFQELIPGPGTFGVGFLAEAGKLLAVNSHWERRSFPCTGGSAVLIEKWNNPQVVEYTRRLLSDLNYSGWGLAEFKFCPSRRDFVFMEINGKFWASLYFTLVNEPAFLRRLFGFQSRFKPCRRMLFADRMLLSGPVTTLLSARYCLAARLVWDQPVLPVLHQTVSSALANTSGAITAMRFHYACRRKLHSSRGMRVSDAADA